MAMEREDTEPWYRQFWPWFVIALPASAVVAGLYTVWLSMQTTDSLVISSDDGINVVTERHDAAEKEALRLGLAASLEIDTTSGAVVVTVPSALAPELSNTLLLNLRHPTLAARDSTVELQRGIPGANGDLVWVGHFVAPPSGRRYVSLSSGDDWRLTGEWSGQARLLLGADESPGNDGR